MHRYGYVAWKDALAWFARLEGCISVVSLGKLHRCGLLARKDEQLWFPGLQGGIGVLSWFARMHRCAFMA